MPPPPAFKIGQKKMAAERGGLYVMFLGTPSPKFLDPLLYSSKISPFRHMIPKATRFILQKMF